MERQETPLRKAVNHLKYIGKIKRDDDLTGIFKLAKTTISTYLNGKPGKKFLKDFENFFNLKISDFELGTKNPKTKSMLGNEFHESEENNLQYERKPSFKVETEVINQLLKSIEELNKELSAKSELIGKKNAEIEYLKRQSELIKKAFGLPDEEVFYEQLVELKIIERQKQKDPKLDTTKTVYKNKHA